MLFQVAHTVFAGETTINNKYTNYPGVINELRAHGAGFAVYDQPRPTARNATGRGVTDYVHFGVMTANFHPGTAGNLLHVTETHFAATQVAATPRAAVVAVHQDHVTFGIKQ